MPKSRRPHKHPGVSPQQEKRDLYIRLMSQGMSNNAACRAVGINSRTGKRWRHGRTVVTSTGRVLTYPPISHQPSAISSRFLPEDERIAIADGLVLGRSLRAIAAELCRPASTVSREVSRNCDAGTGAYNPYRAQRLACARRARPRPGKLALNSELPPSSRVTWRSAGAPSRSAKCWRSSSPTDPRCVWPTRRSTRRSMSRAVASCDVSCRKLFAPAGLVAGRAAGATSATLVLPARS